MRWLHFFSQFEFVITYRPSWLQLMSDALSKFGRSPQELTDHPPTLIIPSEWILEKVPTPAPSQEKLVCQDAFLNLLKAEHLKINLKDWLTMPGNSVKDAATSSTTTFQPSHQTHMTGTYPNEAYVHTWNRKESQSRQIDVLTWHKTAKFVGSFLSQPLYKFMLRWQSLQAAYTAPHITRRRTREKYLNRQMTQ